MRLGASASRSRLRSPKPVAVAALILGAMLAGVGRPVAAQATTQTTRAPLLRTVGVGRDPVALAVDERAGRVFVVGAAGEVSVLDAATGAVVRTIAVGRGAQAVAVDEATGRAFVADQARVYTFDARTSAVLRALPIGGGPTGGLAVDARHGEVFVAARGAPQPVNRGGGFGPGDFAVLDATTGRLRRRIRQYGDPFAVDGTARRIMLPYACGDDTTGFADMCVDTLDAVTGRRLKTADLSSQQGYSQQPSALAVDARAGSAIVFYGDGRGDANIGVVATRTGARRAAVVPAGGSSGVIAVDEAAARVAVVTTPDNYAIATGYGPGSPPAASVSVLDTRSGREVGGDTIPNALGGESSPIGVAADAQRGRFYVLATPAVTGKVPSRTVLDVLDARTGKPLRHLALPRIVIEPDGSPGVAMAVDERTGRLFIANGRDNTVSVLDTARL